MKNDNVGEPSFVPSPMLFPLLLLAVVLMDRFPLWVDRCFT